MPLDYSKIPTSDLEFLSKGDLKSVSTLTLEYLSGQGGPPTAPVQEPPTDEYSEFPMERARSTLAPIEPLARSAAGALAPHMPMAGMIAGGVVGAPAAVAAGPGAPAVEAGAIGLGYMAGTQAQNIMQRYAQGQPQANIGQATKEAAAQIIPSAEVGMAGPIAGKVVEGGLSVAARGFDTLAKKMYESVLKIPPRSVPKFLRDKAIKAGLEGQYAPTEGGWEKLGVDIQAANKAISETIAKDPGKQIEVQVILNRIDELKAGYSKLPEADKYLKEIDKVRRAFLEQATKNGELNMSGAEAQEMKLAIHRIFKPKYKTIANWSQEEFMANEAIAKGLRKELVRLYPELAELNAKDSAMLELQKQLSGAINRTRNWDVVGLVDILGGSLGALAGRQGNEDYGQYGGAVTGLMLTRALRSPVVASRVAFALSKAARTIKGQALPSTTWGENQSMGPVDETLQLKAPAMQMPNQLQLPRGAQTLEEMYPQLALPSGPERLGLPAPSQIQAYGPGVMFTQPLQPAETNVAGPLMRGETVYLKAPLPRHRK